MVYTIICTKDFASKNDVSLCAKGNMYIVYFNDLIGNRCVHKDFESMDEAMEVYNKYVNAFAHGLYDYGTRASWLS